jgi:hypothetical protein
MAVWSTVVLLLLAYLIGFTVFSVRPREKQFGTSNWKTLLVLGVLSFLIAVGMYTPFISGSFLRFTATAFFSLGIAIFGMAVFYMREQARHLPRPNAYSTWKLLVVIAILACGFALTLFNLPVSPF